MNEVALVFYCGNDNGLVLQSFRYMADAENAKKYFEEQYGSPNVYFAIEPTGLVWR